jgi:ribosomal protein L9
MSQPEKQIKPEVKIDYSKFNVSIVYNVLTGRLHHKVSNEDVVRFLKGVFTNRERFETRFLSEFRKIPQELKNMPKEDQEKFKQYNPELFEVNDAMDKLLEIYDAVEPFTYEEAFKIEDQAFQSQVFGSIDIVEMIETLGHKQIKVDGRAVKHKKFAKDGTALGEVEYDVVYETHEVSGSKLNLEENMYAVRCWCTTTEDEHWIWIEDKYKDDPLEAIASTFRIHENLIPHIKELKRQGDILLVEMKDSAKNVEPSGDIVPLTADQYFGLLTAQS